MQHRGFKVALRYVQQETFEGVNFREFRNFVAIRKSFLCKILRHGILWHSKSEQSTKVFSAKIIFFTNSWKSSPSKVFCYTVTFPSDIVAPKADCSLFAIIILGTAVVLVTILWCMSSHRLCHVMMASCMMLPSFLPLRSVSSLVPKPLPDFIPQPWRKIGRRPGIKTTSRTGNGGLGQYVTWTRFVLTKSTISGPWRSFDSRPSPDLSPRLRDKIWEGPGDEANQ